MTATAPMKISLSRRLILQSSTAAHYATNTLQAGERRPLSIGGFSGAAPVCFRVQVRSLGRHAVARLTWQRSAEGNLSAPARPGGYWSYTPGGCGSLHFAAQLSASLRCRSLQRPGAQFSRRVRVTSVSSLFLWTLCFALI